MSTRFAAVVLAQFAANGSAACQPLPTWRAESGLVCEATRNDTWRDRDLTCNRPAGQPCEFDGQAGVRVWDVDLWAGTISEGEENMQALCRACQFADGNYAIELAACYKLTCRQADIFPEWYVCRNGRVFYEKPGVTTRGEIAP
jgi:hypothetical protein